MINWFAAVPLTPDALEALRLAPAWPVADLEAALEKLRAIDPGALWSAVELQRALDTFSAGVYAVDPDWFAVSQAKLMRHSFATGGPVDMPPVTVHRPERLNTDKRDGDE